MATMIAIPGYHLTEPIYESVKTVIYRGYRLDGQNPVILKTPSQEYPGLADLARLNHEYEIIKEIQVRGVVQCYGLETIATKPFLVFEDFGGESLDRLPPTSLFEIKTFLELAIELANTLGELHRHQIIHKDIKPQNIIFNAQTGEVKITDFSIASRLSRETQTIGNPDRLEGTLAYMSPEQTGRMNRALDYRTDFYSLGVTFYELLTGQLPFNTTDAMELVHCHIAKKPVPPCVLNAKTPQPLSDIVLKLLAKTAEERYQSAFGLKVDLQVCLTQLQESGQVQPFILGQQDISESFQISQKLYGRETEIQSLLNAFERSAIGQSELMLIAGYSGIGKSALVQEIYKPITRQRGYFIAGKFDQFQRNIPYFSVIQAFQELVRQLLTESEAQIATWRENLLSALGVNGQIIVDVIPEVELILGKQPPVADLGAAESQNRFNLVFQNFIRVFTQAEHPLVIFLDDLQWADSASLKLLELLISGSDSKYLFLIGAYRDNEVDDAHPLMLALNRLQKTKAVVGSVHLAPLGRVHVNQLIADTLHCDATETLPLAELVIQKTNGNPFFMNEFLKSLYADRLLEFDFNRGTWNWDLERIQTVQITDNVVELMSEKIQKLSDQTQHILKLAACIGNQFDLKTLSVVYEKPLTDTADHLWEAIQAGLVLPIGNTYKLFQSVDRELIPALSEITPPPGTGSRTEQSQLSLTDYQIPGYRFLHDRVQQAAYCLIPDEQKQVVHLQVGQLLLKNAGQQREEKIFDIVNQLNFAPQLIRTQAEREELATLNLIAGKKAKASAAYGPASDYFQLGMDLLNDASWQQCYELMLALQAEAAEVAYLNGEFGEMEQRLETVLQRAKVLLDKVKAYEINIQAQVAQNKPFEAVQTALEVLKLLGISFPEKPNQVAIVLSLLRTKARLSGKRIDRLVDLPEMTDPYHLAAMRILSSVFSAAFFAAPNLLPLTVFKQVNLSIQYGNTAESAAAYAAYGLLLCGVVGEIDTGYQFGQLAMSLLSRFNTQKLSTRVIFMFNNFVRHWRDHVRETLNPFLQAYATGLETGNLEFAAYCAFCFCGYSFSIGKELTELESKMTTYSRAIQQLQQMTAFNFNQILHQTALNLMGQSVHPSTLIGEAYDEQAMLPIHQEVNDQSAIYFLHLNKLILNCFFEDYTQAVDNATTAEKFIGGSVGTIHFCQFYFYESLAQLGTWETLNRSGQSRVLARVKANQKRFQKWAHHSPANHLHQFYLVEAERYRVLGKGALAGDYYDRAIAQAKEHDYLHEEALAQELAAKFYLVNGKPVIAQAYMQNAYACYTRWGALAKVKHLEDTYAPLLPGRGIEASLASGIRRGNTNPLLRSSSGTLSGTTTGTFSSTTSTSSSTDSRGAEVLDLSTVLKASQAIASEIVLDKLLSTLMRAVIQNAGATRGFFILSRDGELKIEAAGEVDRDQVTVLQSIPVNTSGLLPAAIVNYVLRTQTDVVLENASQEGLFTSDTFVSQNQSKSVLCTPITNQGKLVGILYLENNLTTGAFTPNRIEVLRILASQAAISIDNALLYQTLEQKVEERTAQLAQANDEIVALNDRLKAENLRMRTELDITRQLQQMILPKEHELKRIDGLQISGFMEPADEVGGDYYDVLEHNGAVKIGIGDVTGHGLESGVLMLMVQTAIRTLMTHNETNPTRFLDTINRTVFNNTRRMKSQKNLTLSLLDYQQGKLRISGQHEEILVVRADGQVERIDTFDLGFPLGVVEDIAEFVTQIEITLAPGDGVVLYTDGVTEAENRSKQLYGLERLCRVISENWDQSADGVRQAIVDDIRQHIGEHKVYDDITLVVLKQT